MRKANRYALPAAGLVVLAVLLLVLRPVRQVGQTAQVGAGESATAAAALALPASDSPLPTAAMPAPPELATLPPDATPVDWTEISKIPVVVQFSELTPVPLTPEPWVPPTPYPEDKHVSDPEQVLSIMVPKGWYAFFPSSFSQGIGTVANFDLGAMEGRPEGGVMAELGIGKLKEGQTFEQWLAEQRESIKSDPYGPGPTFMTDNQPITLGKYSGIIYDIGLIMDDGQEHTFQTIFLPINDRLVASIIIKPLPSPDYEKVLSILTTLTITPNEAIVTE